MKKALPHLIGFVFFFLAGVANGILYILVVGKLLDRGGDGFGLSAAIVTFPLLGLMLSVAWTVIKITHEHFQGPMTLARVLLFSGALGLVASIVIAGPSGFTLSHGSGLFNYFLIDLVVGAAALQHIVFRNQMRGAR